ncbi:MAG: hypothetical protein Q7T07_04055 [Burkholderiaceae bacterium]|nr:hypothetical protein [Burkholderiaceae bacterium]
MAVFRLEVQLDLKEQRGIPVRQDIPVQRGKLEQQAVQAALGQQEIQVPPAQGAPPPEVLL